MPLLVNELDTGSVAMNTKPKAKPPSTKCHWKVIENIGLVSEPIVLNKVAHKNAPIRTPAITLHDAMPVTKIIKAPTAIINVEPSPIQPGMFPKNASIQVIALPAVSTKAF